VRQGNGFAWTWHAQTGTGPQDLPVPYPTQSTAELQIRAGGGNTSVPLADTRIIAGRDLSCIESPYRHINKAAYDGKEKRDIMNHSTRKKRIPSPSGRRPG
jgi:hypothetical protein